MKSREKLADVYDPQSSSPEHQCWISHSGVNLHARVMSGMHESSLSRIWRWGIDVWNDTIIRALICRSCEINYSPPRQNHEIANAAKYATICRSRPANEAYPSLCQSWERFMCQHFQILCRWCILVQYVRDVSYEIFPIVCGNAWLLQTRIPHECS